MLYKCIDCGKEGNGHKDALRCISCACKKAWAEGKMCKFASETRARMSESAKRRGDIEASHNAEARAKQSETMKRVTADPIYRASMSANRKKDSSNPEWRKAVSDRIHAAHIRGVYDEFHNRGSFGPSSLEVLLAGALDRAGISYIQQYRPPGCSRIYDFMLQDQRLLIEVDGEHWHSDAKAEAIDKEKDLMAVRFGYDMLRVSESDLHDVGPDEIVRIWILQ